MRVARPPAPWSSMVARMSSPSQPKPVPVKPYFFDIAYNYIGVEEKAAEPVAAKVEKVEEKKPEPAKKGWFWR